MNRIFSFIVILLLLTKSYTNAQNPAPSLDDSTKQIYSYKTVKYILEEDVLNNQKTFYSPDTTLQNFHLFDNRLKNGWLYQDLGNLGTAIKPLFYQATTDIAQQLGYNAYTFYAFDARKTHYYNTKSPYTNMAYVQSNNGASILHFTHSQNINSQLNTTLEVRRLVSSKLYGPPARREDRLVDSWAFILHSNYESKNKKYILLTTYNHFNHAPLEQGGIKPLEANDEFIDANNISAYGNYYSKLTKASSRDWRNELHVFHQYKLANGLQAYHILDYQQRRDFYTDANFGLDSAMRSSFYHLPTSKKDSSILSINFRYRLLENNVGLKGIYKGFAYRLYLRQRFYGLKSFTEPFLDKNLKSETIVGGSANYYFPDSTRKVLINSEIGTINAAGNLKLQGEYLSKNIRLSYLLARVPPTIFDNTFQVNNLSSEFYNWNNNFNKTTTQTLDASIRLAFKNLSFLPSLNYSLIKNYIFYDSLAQVTQTATPISIFNIGLGVAYRWKRFFISNQSYLIINSEKDIIHLPTLKDIIHLPTFVNNTRIGYEFIYAKKLHINTGIDIYYRSAYFADNYMPLTRQFYWQDKQKAWGTPVADVFVDMKISKIRLFFKFAYINQGLPQKAYYMSSTYPGLPRTFFLGVNWPLFD